MTSKMTRFQRSGDRTRRLFSELEYAQRRMLDLQLGNDALFYESDAGFTDVTIDDESISRHGFRVPRHKTPEFLARTRGRQNQRGVRETTRLVSGVVPDREANRRRAPPRAGKTGRGAERCDSRACVRWQDTGILRRAEVGKKFMCGWSTSTARAHIGPATPGHSRQIPE